MTVCCHELVYKLFRHLSLQHVVHDDADHAHLTCNSDSLAQQDTSMLLLLVLGLLSLPHLFAFVTVARQNRCM